MAKRSLIKGNSPDIINANIQTLKDGGYSHARAVRCAMCHANKKHDSTAKKIAAKVAKSAPVGVRIKGSF